MTEQRRDAGIDPADKTAQREMWDSWWYDRFEIPHAIPSGARRLELEMGGETFGAVLLDRVAPKTCQAFWDILPYRGNMIHCAWFGHAAFYLDRVPLLATLGHTLENRFQRLAPGDIVWDPYIEEVTIAYGRNAFVNFPTTVYAADGRPHPNQVCIFGRVVDNLDGFAVMCKRLRYEGTKPMTTRRLEDANTR
jgi:hypothetical protein